MKTYSAILIKLLFSCVVVLSINSCNIEEINTPIEENYQMALVTKSLHTDNYSVTTDDLYKYIGKKRQISELYEHKDVDGNILFYIANFKKGGYEIISGDKRTYPTLAFSQTGTLDVHNGNENYKLWIEDVSEQLKSLNSCDTLTANMEYNIMTWDFITGQNKTTNTKSSRASYYYLIDFETQSYYSINVDPLLHTQWGQGDYLPNDHYWNKYCPWKDNTMTGGRCPAGCSAVAVGQYLYYLNNFYSLNITIPASATCNGYGGLGNYSQVFSNTYTSLSELPLDYFDTDSTKIEQARIFLAYIGHLLNTTYNSNSSSAYTSSVSNCLNHWGIPNTTVAYADSTVRRILLKQEPIITRADRLTENDDLSGHMWIIDGYRKSRTLRRNYYYVSSVQLSQAEISQLTMDDWNSYDEWELPEEITYHMNWGWNGSNNGWYSHDSWRVSSRNYSLNKKVIYKR